MKIRFIRSSCEKSADSAKISDRGRKGLRHDTAALWLLSSLQRKIIYHPIKKHENDSRKVLNLPIQVEHFLRKLAQRVGFEPTVPLPVHLISSQGRYNHFDTAAYAYSVSATHAVRIIITKAQVKIKCKFGRLPFVRTFHPPRFVCKILYTKRGIIFISL